MNFYDSIPICFWVNKFVIVPYKYTFTLNLTCAGQGLQSIQNVISYNHKLRTIPKEALVKTTKTRLDTFLFISHFITNRKEKSFWVRIFFFKLYPSIFTTVNLLTYVYKYNLSNYFRYIQKIYLLSLSSMHKNTN